MKAKISKSNGIENLELEGSAEELAKFIKEKEQLPQSQQVPLTHILCAHEFDLSDLGSTARFCKRCHTLVYTDNWWWINYPKWKYEPMYPIIPYYPDWTWRDPYQQPYYNYTLTWTTNTSPASDRIQLPDCKQ